MKLEDYQSQALATMLDTHQYGDIDARLVAAVLGLVGESGEVAEKFKKYIRDKSGQLSEEDKAEILKELGDVLWFINAIANMLGGSLEVVAQKNLDKIQSRKERGVQHGSGDNR